MEFNNKEEITREEAEKSNNDVYSKYGLMDEESVIKAYARYFNDSESGDEWRIDPLLQAEAAEGITEDSYIKKKE